MAGACVTLTILMCSTLSVVVGAGCKGPVMDLEFLSEGDRVDKLPALKTL